MGKKCCLCLAREAVGVFTVRQTVSCFGGSREMESEVRACFCARCKDKGIEKALLALGESALDKALTPGITHHDTWHEWKEISEQENT